MHVPTEPGDAMRIEFHIFSAIALVCAGRFCRAERRKNAKQIRLASRWPGPNAEQTRRGGRGTSVQNKNCAAYQTSKDTWQFKWFLLYTYFGVQCHCVFDFDRHTHTHISIVPIRSQQDFALLFRRLSFRSPSCSLLAFFLPVRSHTLCAHP